MMLEDVIKSAIARAGVVRVRSAPNPLLWGFVWTVSFSISTYLFKDDAAMKYLSLTLAALPGLLALAIGIMFAYRDPNRLQSEEFVIRQQELTMIEKRAAMCRRPIRPKQSRLDPCFPATNKWSCLLRNYLLVFNGNQTTRRIVISRIDSIAAIVNWIAFFDNALCVVSASEASELGELIRKAIPDVQFIVTGLEPGKRKGRLPKSVWDFLKQPTTVTTEAAE